MRKNRLCGETVTLYHPDPAAQTVCRRVLRGVSWQQGRREKPDAAGTKQGTALLLVIPEAAGQYGADYTLDPGDRVLLGEVPGVAWADWPGFVPAAVPARTGASCGGRCLVERQRHRGPQLDEVKKPLASPSGEKLPPAGG